MMKKLLAAFFIFWQITAVAYAQNAVTLPYAAQAVADLGNGPVKVRVTQGNASIFTAQGSGSGSTSGPSTALTLTATPATPPVVGALISGPGITSGTTVTAYNGTTGVTLSAAMTVPAASTVSWGAACPASAAGIPSQFIQASVSADYYLLYTQARICAISPGGSNNALLVLPVFYDQPTPLSVESFNGRTGIVVPQIGDYNISQITSGLSDALTSAQVFVGNGSNVATGVALSQDCTISNAGVITCTKTNNVAFAPSATTDTTNASNISSGTLATAHGGVGRNASADAANTVSVADGIGNTISTAMFSLLNSACSTSLTRAACVSFMGYANVNWFGAVGDGQIASDISCTNGSALVTSATPHFASGDVGKYILLENCANGSAPLPATIATFGSSTSITISANAGATLSSMRAQWGTNSNTAFATAITAARGTGYVYAPCGTYIITALNLTNWAGGSLEGAGGTYGCTILTPDNNFNIMVDMTGSPAFRLRNIQIGFFSQIGIGNAGYVNAPSQATAGIDDVFIDDVFVQGFFTAAACYRDRMASSHFNNNMCFNYTQAGTAAAVTFTRNNANNVQSSFTTTNTNTTTMGCSDFTTTNEESHGINAAGTASTNFAIRIEGCTIIRWSGGNIDSSNASMILVNDANGVTPDYLTFIGLQFYAELGPNPTNIFGGGASAMSHIYILNPWTVTSVTCANSGGCTRGVLLP